MKNHRNQLTKKSATCKTIGLLLTAGLSLSLFAENIEKPAINLSDKFTIFEEDSLRLINCEKTDIDSYRCTSLDLAEQQDGYQLGVMRLSDDMLVLRGENSETKQSWVYSAKLDKSHIKGSYQHTGMKKKGAFRLLNVN